MRDALMPEQCRTISAMLLRYAALVRSHRDQFAFMDDRSPFKGQEFAMLTLESEQAEEFAAKIFSSGV